MSNALFGYSCTIIMHVRLLKCERCSDGASTSLWKSQCLSRIIIEELRCCLVGTSHLRGPAAGDVLIVAHYDCAVVATINGQRQGDAAQVTKRQLSTLFATGSS